jgi:hypothetical protein
MTVESDLQGKVAVWLAGEGYPLEMQVARAWLRAGFHVQQAEYYEDPETKTLREIDVVADALISFGRYLVRLVLCMECKVIKDKPWVLLTSPDLQLASPAQVVQRAASIYGLNFLRKVAHNETYQNLQILRLPTRPGYGLIQALAVKGNDVAYAACMSVAKASASRVVETDAGIERGSLILEIVVPVIVVDGRLFESFLDQEGDVKVNEVFEGTLVWRNRLVQRPHTIIRVVTLQYLPQLIKEAEEAATLLQLSERDVRQAFSR